MTAVWYVGTSNVRSISVVEWNRAGISGPGVVDSVWNSSNGWSLPAASFTTAQLSLLDGDGSFVRGADGPRPGASPASLDAYPASILYVNKAVAAAAASVALRQDLGPVSGSVTVDVSKGHSITLSLVGSTVITFTGWQGGLAVESAVLAVVVSTAGSTLTIAGSRSSFGVTAGQATLNLSTTSGAIDKVSCETWDGGITIDTAIVAQQLA